MDHRTDDAVDDRTDDSADDALADVVDPTEAPASTEHWRPAAHFTSRQAWLNDPNGLLYHRGTYHLFFQCNPEGNVWGNLSWGHATSTDLVTWHEHEVAIRCTPEEMIFSGSAVVDEHNSAGLAKPGQTALVAVYTSCYTDASDRAGIQAQSLAYSLDDGMTWRRYAGNPVLDRGSNDFRDPKVFWHGGADGRWVMVAVEAPQRTVLIHSSPDLIHWTLLSQFGPAHSQEGLWECPDLFPVRIRGSDEHRWVLVVSVHPGGISGGSAAQYFVGDFDGARFTPERLSDSDDPVTFDWLDFGRDHYGAVSFNNVPGGRRLLMAWASNWSYGLDTPTHPWRSCLSLVRQVELVRMPDGRLRLAQQPVLPADPAMVQVVNLKVPSGPGVVSEVVMSASDPAIVSRAVLHLDGDRRAVTFDRTLSGALDFHHDFASSSTAPLLTEGVVTAVRIVIDASIVEIYVDDGLVTLTEQVFPPAPFTQVSMHSGPAV